MSGIINGIWLYHTNAHNCHFQIIKIKQVWLVYTVYETKRLINYSGNKIKNTLNDKSLKPKYFELCKKTKKKWFNRKKMNFTKNYK